MGAHWNKIKQPVLLMVDTDDAMFLSGVEVQTVEPLAVTLENAELGYCHGCSHMPQGGLRKLHGGRVKNPS